MPIYVYYNPPFHWEAMLEHLFHRLTAGVDTISRGKYVRTVDFDGDVGVLCVEHDGENNRLIVTTTSRLQSHRERIAKRVARMFDLQRDLRPIDSHLGKDPVLCRLQKMHPGVRVPGGWSPFEILVRTIVGQQVSVAAATTVMGRIMKRTAGKGEKLPSSVLQELQRRELTLLFPPPAAFAEADLSAIGMPARRVATLQALSRLIAQEDIVFPRGDETLNDGEKEAVKGALLAQYGIGPWTVEYFALRALKDVDAWPGTDLILRRALQAHPDAKVCSIREIVDRWRPFRAYAAVRLWYGVSIGQLSI